MMGHSYYGGSFKSMLGSPDQEVHEEKFAWWPVRSTFNKKRIWLTKYHIVHILYDDTGRPPIKGFSWPLLYTKNEYLMMLLKSEE
jgi:hypothetical protein|tara:strand:+ start:2080 stop:2334 length:255 start_codon:yes stop_codon:yes gene_type:complete